MLNTQVLTQNKRVLIFVAVFALTAVIFLLAQILASADVAVFEAEQATPSSGATVQQDTNSSGGQYVAFANPGDPEPDPEPTPGGLQFFEDFQTASSLDRFRYQVHNFPDYRGGPETWLADHDLNCGPPTTQRTINAAEFQGGQGDFDWPGAPGETVYWCAPGGDINKAHMMTSMTSNGYAQVDFMPDQVFNDVTEVCWDQSMGPMGNRQWTQFTIVPEAEFQKNNERLDYVRPNFGPPASQGVQPAEDVVIVVIMEGKSKYSIGEISDGLKGSLFVNLNQAERFQVCVRDLGNGTIEVTQERPDDKSVTQNSSGSFPKGLSRVIFQDDNYNPPKSTKCPCATTWHWDNIAIK